MFRKIFLFCYFLMCLMICADAYATPAQPVVITPIFTPSVLNSSTTQLPASGTFTGTIESIPTQPMASVLITTDQTLTFIIYQCTDSACVDMAETSTYQVLPMVKFSRQIAINGNYLYVYVQNTGSAATTIFNLNIQYGPMPGGTENTTLVGGMTREVCVVPTVTGGAYTAGYEVGGLITLANAIGSLPTGVIQNVRLNFKTAQTSEFDVTFFQTNPSNSTWTDHAAPSINALDVAAVMPTIKLTNYSSVLGTHTVYGQDSIGRAVSLTSTSLYAVVTTPGTPTLGSTSDMQLCVAVFGDD